MSSKSIILRGVSTHNLKNIDTEIPINKITAIYGRSGAGKSSLAFSTLYQLCKDEFDALECGYFDTKDYRLTGYENLIPAVAIPQKNTNNNPRSTLYSLLNISQILQSAIVQHEEIGNKFDLSLLRINKPENSCHYCDGLGEVSEIALNDSIDRKLSIEEHCFKLWKCTSYSDYHYKLLLIFCSENNIEITIPFDNLPSNQQQILLSQESEYIYRFRAKHAGKSRNRKDRFVGYFNYLNNNKNLKAVVELAQKWVCLQCQGSRINTHRYQNVSIGNISFDEFLTMPFNELLPKLKDQSYHFLHKIIHELCNLNLGYLFFSRSIPSLSGGELQKIKFSRMLNSDISGVLIVIDEISSQLNPTDYPMILSSLKKLAKRNTVVLVEHAQFFIDNADIAIHIGKYAGRNGGQIYKQEKINPIDSRKPPVNIRSWIEIKKISRNNVKDQSISIPTQALTVFTGVSGSGKSSIALFIKEKEKAFYVSQKINNYTIRSTLAVSSKLQEFIAQYFASKTKIAEEYFLTTKDGGCPYCKGIGVIKYERSFDSDIYINCPKCDGKLFDKDGASASALVNGKAIIDIYDMEIQELIVYFHDAPAALKVILDTLINLSLGHLKLNRKTQTLSGGELRRLKLCEYFARQRESKKILIIDEPMSGLDAETASKVADFIKQKTDLFQAVIVIEHRSEILPFCDFEVKIGPYAGKNGGVVLSQTKL
ncbi:MAG: ATP-binding cassette domain-containing protein [Methyloprofundus sp.]|nr:ATP-binding cassette domain-containing protein [Methyloprofundus sp.]